ncbi:GyrI-like domain-containing protein [Staphylococcus sp. NRL 16/872]|uniref:GyrI-like domain-containing protein n=1 Tax=Staphylococcus sp. NRL 16/872 TaxID=2930131 RepID=UPI001FB44F6B|nr:MULTISPECIES: GyrI-like domain-containing protein [unclassified Staphylococcus]MCJ1657081.1 GyrI-like domain-containing protein [Staphylococcus sp. NRL 21/187]MCJ1662827.1 GyrI-like domain-containing protein [Staphylococcus sp. NRL 18/288]MCJ1668942.1 GyrI-like domain-containing protein [Staphylococcus sp. NRL 19/737]WEN69159.1 GyrI-like domain-containing protein [Staphylococcus sp. NRL 16/872]
MNYEIEKLNDSEVIYMRNIGDYGSNQNYKMMKDFKNWIRVNGYWKYVEKYGVLGIALDNPQEVENDQCRYDLILKIDETVEDSKVNKRNFTGGIYAVFTIPHTKESIVNFFNNLENILKENELNMRYDPIIERYKEEEGLDKICEMLVPIQ